MMPECAALAAAACDLLLWEAGSEDSGGPGDLRTSPDPDSDTDSEATLAWSGGGVWGDDSIWIRRSRDIDIASEMAEKLDTCVAAGPSAENLENLHAALYISSDFSDDTENLDEDFRCTGLATADAHQACRDCRIDHLYPEKMIENVDTFRVAAGQSEMKPEDLSTVPDISGNSSADAVIPDADAGPTDLAAADYGGCGVAEERRARPAGRALADFPGDPRDPSRSCGRSRSRRRGRPGSPCGPSANTDSDSVQLSKPRDQNRTRRDCRS